MFDTEILLHWLKLLVLNPIRTAGSHNIYERRDVSEMVNIQSDKGTAKSYQIKQFLSLVEKYSLRLEGE